MRCPRISAQAALAGAASGETSEAVASTLLVWPSMVRPVLVHLDEASRSLPVSVVAGLGRMLLHDGVSIDGGGLHG